VGLNRLQLPVDVAVAEDGGIYVADKDRNAIIVYDATEHYLKTIGRADLQPISVAVFKDRLYVSNMKSQVIEVLDRQSGRQLGTIGAVGDEDGQFRLPICVEVDADGQVHVMDMMRGRLQTFTPDGRLVMASGDIADTAGHFVRPKHIAVDDDGITYVVDAAFDNVQLFDARQQLLMHFGSMGTHRGSMNLPVGVCVMETGLEYFRPYIHPGFKAKRLIVVTNQFGDQKISVYALGERRPEWKLEDLNRAAEPVPEGVSTAPPVLSPADEGQVPPEEPEPPHP
jgi:DNA-binding beta-propeller fold protein YncE